MTVLSMWKRLKSAIAVFVFEQLDFIFLCVSAIHARPTLCKDYVMSCLSYLSHWFIRRRSDYIIGFITPAIGPNKSRKRTRLIAPGHNIRGKVWMKNNIHGFTDRQLSSVKPSMLFFIQTLPRLLCVGAISRVSFLDLFGPIAGVLNPVM